VHLLDGPELSEGTSGLAQLRLESPVATARGDHYLLRLYAPMLTLGGGEILDPSPSKHRKSAAAAAQLEQLEHADPVELVATTLERGRMPFHTARSLATELALPEDAVARALEAGLQSGVLARTGEQCFHEARLSQALARLQAALEAYHVSHPPSPGMDRLTLAHAHFPQLPPEAFDLLVGLAMARGVVEAEQNLLKRKGWRPRAGDKLQAGVRLVETRLAEAPELFLSLRSLEPECKLMRHEFQELVKFMGVSQLAVKVGPDLLVSKANFDRLLETALGVLKVRGTASTPELKDALGMSRKYLIPFLEHLDQTGVTARSGNDRVLRSGRQR
jgi:selenocysteine-specific elongation factor